MGDAFLPSQPLVLSALLAPWRRVVTAGAEAWGRGTTACIASSCIFRELSDEGWVTFGCSGSHDWNQKSGKWHVSSHRDPRVTPPHF